jgi:hypothetical protein
MKINLFLSLLKLGLSYMLWQIYNYCPVAKIYMVIPMVKSIIAGKLTVIRKGCFKVAVDPSADERTIAEAKEVKKVIHDNLHDGGTHTRFWHKNPGGSITLVGKVTHVDHNPNTKEANIPIKTYVENAINEPFDPQSKSMFDNQSKMDHRMNIEIDPQLIKENKMQLFPYLDQNRLPKQLLDAIANTAPNKPTHKIEYESKCKQGEKEKINNENNKVSQNNLLVEKNKKLSMTKDIRKSIDDVD